MKQIYLVRHGQTDWNAQGRFIGRYNPKLSLLGQQQARALADRMSHIPLSAVYSSSRRRAKETAGAISDGRGLEVVVKSAFDEIDFGSWEQLTLTEIQARDLDLVDRWLENPAAVAIPEGEPWLHFTGRVLRGWKKLVAQTDGEDVAVVSHGGALRVILLSMMDLDPVHFIRLQINHASISIVDLSNGSPELVDVNDIAHLRDLSLVE